jgi:uncharacterized protein
MDQIFAPSFCGAPLPNGGATLPSRAGVGLKPEHFRHIVDTWPDIGFFEIHAENYMVDGGPYHHYLTRIRERYPLSIHGVGLSIGGERAINTEHLGKLATLINRYEPQSFSEHLAWSSHDNVYLNDLLPIPYNATTLQRVCDHIDEVQTCLKRRMLLENPATYIEFASSTMLEADFINTVLQRTGCGLLLDVNNVYVSSINHHRDPFAAITAIAALAHRSVEEIHLAGFTQLHDSSGIGADDSLLIDSHGSPVAQAVWQLYEHTLAHVGARPTLIERDSDVPVFDVLYQEAQQAENLMEAGRTRHLIECVA